MRGGTLFEGPASFLLCGFGGAGSFCEFITMTGTITKIIEARGFGFIAPLGYVDVFFHANDLQAGLQFDEQLTGQRVEFAIESSSKGPRAVDVRPAKD